MKLSNITHRVVAGTLLATLALSSVAPAAFADRGRNRGGGHAVRYKGGHGHGRHVVVRERVRVVERHRGSDWGPAVAGLIGGIAIGAILSNRAEAAPVYDARNRGDYPARAEYRPAYVYEDPYCNREYATLDAYLGHTRGNHCDHWPIARVIDRRSGDCERTIAWHDGGWHDYDDSDPDWERWDD